MMKPSTLWLLAFAAAVLTIVMTREHGRGRSPERGATCANPGCMVAPTRRVSEVLSAARYTALAVERGQPEWESQLVWDGYCEEHAQALWIRARSPGLQDPVFRFVEPDFTGHPGSWHDDPSHGVVSAELVNADYWRSADADHERHLRFVNENTDAVLERLLESTRFAPLYAQYVARLSELNVAKLNALLVSAAHQTDPECAYGVDTGREAQQRVYRFLAQFERETGRRDLLSDEERAAQAVPIEPAFDYLRLLVEPPVGDANQYVTGGYKLLIRKPSWVKFSQLHDLFEDGELTKEECRKRMQALSEALSAENGGLGGAMDMTSLEFSLTTEQAMALLRLYAGQDAGDARDADREVSQLYGLFRDGKLTKEECRARVQALMTR